MLGIGENGFDSWDYSGDSVWYRIDGWMEAHYEVPKHPAKDEGTMACYFGFTYQCGCDLWISVDLAIMLKNLMNSDVIRGWLYFNM